MAQGYRDKVRLNMKVLAVGLSKKCMLHDPDVIPPDATVQAVQSVGNLSTLLFLCRHCALLIQEDFADRYAGTDLAETSFTPEPA